MFGSLAMPTVKWYVSYQLKEIIFYLCEVNDTCTITKWSQRREKAVQFISSSDAQRKADDIKTKRKHNKKMTLKVI